MTITRLVLTLALGLALWAPQAAAGGREPGSRLYYPVHNSETAFTVLSVSNTNTTPATQGNPGGTTLVRYQYVNIVPDPAAPLEPANCFEFEVVELLTPADTFSVLTACHNVQPGAQGYVRLTAQDPNAFDVDWAFDHLQGSEIVITAAGGIYSLNAIPFKADPDGVVGPDDQIAYEPFPARLNIDTFVAPLRQHLSLTAFISDPSHRALVQFTGYNDNEQPFSTAFDMGCWFDQRLDSVALFTSANFLALTNHDPSELDVSCNGVGTLETGWITMDCIRVTDITGSIVDDDGVPLLGALTSGPTTIFDFGRNLWEEGDEVIDG